MVRLRLFAENNFTVIETMGVVAAARYIFELAVWLRLFQLERLYGLVYFDQLLATQEKFYKDTLKQLRAEVEWLKALEGKEAASHREALLTAGKSISASRAIDVVSKLGSVSTQLDSEAARRFSLYADDARKNGYGFQAFLVESKAVPKVEQAVTAIAAERQAFNLRAAASIRHIRPDRWQWRTMADRVGRVQEYDYLYSYASKLLHATPASITTDQKSLEEPELILFLSYISVTMTDLCILAAEYGSGRAGA